ncbi:MAG TPA: hypothetical protein VH591_05730 [Ktedonobacterales bacterium]
MGSANNTMTVMRDTASGDTGPQRRGPQWRMGIAHGAWILVVLINAAIFVPAVPFYYQNLLIPCTSANPGQDCNTGQLAPSGIATLARLGISLQTYAAAALIVIIIQSLIFFTIGALIAWRRWHQGLGLFVSIVLITFGATGSSDTLLGSYQVLRYQLTPTVVGIFDIASIVITFLQWPALGTFLLTFPNGRFAPRWSVLVVALWVTNIFAFALTPPVIVTTVSVALTFGFTMLVQIDRYRRLYTTVERQQTKWLVFAMVFSVVIEIGVAIARSIIPGLNAPDSIFALTDVFASGLLFLFVALAVGVALLRYRLYDIDIIIRRTLVYGSVTAVLAITYAVVVIALQRLLTLLVPHASNTFAIVVTTLLIAAIFQPLRSTVQRGVDRRFYRHKYDAARTLASFGSTLRNEVNLEDLTRQLITTVSETMQPAHISLWLRQPDKR